MRAQSKSMQASAYAKPTARTGPPTPSDSTELVERPPAPQVPPSLRSGATGSAFAALRPTGSAFATLWRDRFRLRYALARQVLHSKV